jgi:hypothetical protein
MSETEAVYEPLVLSHLRIEMSGCTYELTATMTVEHMLDRVEFVLEPSVEQPPQTPAPAFGAWPLGELQGKYRFTATQTHPKASHE